MEFIFEVVARDSAAIEVDLFLRKDGSYYKKTLEGTLIFSIEEWEHLKAMLLFGAMFFMDNEAIIKIKERSSIHAYTKGV
jgi:hypothetical protein